MKRPKINERMITLGYSSDRRRRRRAWRQYFRANGAGAQVAPMNEALREMERLHSQPALTSEHLQMVRAFGSVAAALALRNNIAARLPTEAQERK